MSDPTDIATIATHGGAGLGAAGLATWIQRFFASKEAARVEMQLALVAQKLDTVALAVASLSNIGERMALAESALKALHERMDSYDRKGRRR